MNIKWAATLLIVVGALAAWRVAASRPDGAGRTNPDMAAPAPTIDARGAALATQVARLRDRLEPHVSPRLARDVFRFAARASRPAPVALVVNRAPVEKAAAPPLPALTLIGVAEDTAAGGLIRTAIISGSGEVYIVKEGERVTPRYQVARIAPEIVELRDLSDASVRRLTLK
jgi:hypothetical protein